METKTGLEAECFINHAANAYMENWQLSCMVKYRGAKLQRKIATAIEKNFGEVLGMKLHPDQGVLCKIKTFRTMEIDIKREVQDAIMRMQRDLYAMANRCGAEQSTCNSCQRYATDRTKVIHMPCGPLHPGQKPFLLQAFTDEDEGKTGKDKRAAARLAPSEAMMEQINQRVAEMMRGCEDEPTESEDEPAETKATSSLGDLFTK
jgi:hypothetical protein